MKSITNTIAIFLLIYLFITSCDSRPKVVEGEPIVIEEPSNSSNGQTDLVAAQNENIKKEISTHGPLSVIPIEGSIKLSELFAEPKKYEGKVILVTGKCVKINAMIMDRNWIHIQDGSGDDLDLTITTTDKVTIDAIVSFEGTIALNKDFGAGYKYDIIMEQAILK